VSDWYEKQLEANAEGMRGPRPGFADPAENRKKKLKVQQDTFLIFRPWQGCQRCKKLVEDGEIVLPDESDITCRHTRHREYVTLLNKLRNATRGEAFRLAYDEFNNERGERYAAVTWEEPEDGPNEAEARPRGVPRL